MIVNSSSNLRTLEETLEALDSTTNSESNTLESNLGYVKLKTTEAKILVQTLKDAIPMLQEYERMKKKEEEKLLCNIF